MNIHQLKEAIATQYHHKVDIAKANFDNWRNQAPAGPVNHQGQYYFQNREGTLAPVEPDRWGDRATAVVTRHPVATGASVLGGLVLNQMLGKPVEGLVDFATLDMANFRPNTHAQQDIPPVQIAGQVPPLSGKDAVFEMDRLRKNIARDMITLGQLEQMQSAGQFR